MLQLGTCKEGHKHLFAEDNRVLAMEMSTFLSSIEFFPTNAKKYAEQGFQTYKKDLLTISEACEFLTFSRSSLYRGVKAGKIPARQIAGVIRFDLAELSLLKSGEDSTFFILPQEPTEQDTPKKRRGRIPTPNNPDELLAILNS